MLQGGDEEFHYLRHAISSLRQSLDLLTHIQRQSLGIAAAQSVEQIFRILVATVPTIIPAQAIDGFFKRPGSQTLYQLRHFFETSAELPPIPEEALAWAQKRQVQTVLPIANTGAIYCPLIFQNADLGYLLIYSTDNFNHFNETTVLALDMLAEQSAGAAQGLWNRASLEERSTVLQDTRILLDSILDALPQPLVSLDAAGHLLLANKAADKLFGRNLNILTGQHYQMVFPAEVVEMISENYLPVQKGKSGTRNGIRFNNFLGEPRTSDFNASPLPLGTSHGRGMVLIGTQTTP